jgi:hypothetical protein
VVAGGTIATGLVTRVVSTVVVVVTGGGASCSQLTIKKPAAESRERKMGFMVILLLGLGTE